MKSSLNLNYCCYNYYSNYDYDSIIVNFKVVDYYCCLNAAADSIITFKVISDSSDVGYHFTRIVIAIVNCDKLIITAGVTIVIIVIKASIAVD